MKDVVHGLLEGSTSISRPKNNNFVCECTPRGRKCCFLLIHVDNMDLVIPR